MSRRRMKSEEVVVHPRLLWYKRVSAELLERGSVNVVLSHASKLDLQCFNA